MCIKWAIKCKNSGLHSQQSAGCISITWVHRGNLREVERGLQMSMGWVRGMQQNGWISTLMLCKKESQAKVMWLSLTFAWLKSIFLTLTWLKSYKKSRKNQGKVRQCWWKSSFSHRKSRKNQEKVILSYITQSHDQTTTEYIFSKKNRATSTNSLKKDTHDTL